MTVSTSINIIFLLVTFKNFSSFSQADISGDIKPTVQKVENYLNSIEEVGFSGTVLLELNGSVVSSKGYGFGNIDKNIKNTPGTIFDIGSITKQFTAAAILKLEMQGKLSTNDKISRYFRNVPKDKLEITIHDLLRHQSGLQSNVGGDYDKITKPAFIDSVMHSQLKFEPALRFSYSNIVSVDFDGNTELKFEIVPNPNYENEATHIVLNKIPENVLSITIQDLNGILLYESKRKLNSNKFEIPNEFTNGIYLVKIVSKNSVQTKRMMIK